MSLVPRVPRPTRTPYTVWSNAPGVLSCGNRGVSKNERRKAMKKRCHQCGKYDHEDNMLEYEHWYCSLVCKLKHERRNQWDIMNGYSPNWRRSESCNSILVTTAAKSTWPTYRLWCADTPANLPCKCCSAPRRVPTSITSTSWGATRDNEKRTMPLLWEILPPRKEQRCLY